VQAVGSSLGGRELPSVAGFGAAAARPSGWAGSLPVVEMTGRGGVEAVAWSETRTPAKRRGRVADCIGDDCRRGGCWNRYSESDSDTCYLM
jgi:hypothetical protein